MINRAVQLSAMTVLLRVPGGFLPFFRHVFFVEYFVVATLAIRQKTAEQREQIQNRSNQNTRGCAQKEWCDPPSRWKRQRSRSSQCIMLVAVIREGLQAGKTRARQCR